MATNNRSNGSVENYEGNISIDENGNGLLTMNTEIEFLKSISIRYIGSEDQYIAQTSYGMLYLSLVDQPYLSGKLYMYQNRNDTDPKRKKETLYFETKP